MAKKRKQHMKTFQLPQSPKGLIFDMDGTLYTDDAYIRHQNDVMVGQLAKIKSWTIAQAVEEVENLRQQFTERNNGRKPALGTVITELGIPMAVGIEWRTSFIKPENFLKANLRLTETIKGLAAKYRLAIITNNTVAIATRTLSILEILEFFPVIIGLDSTGAVKPDPKAFRMAGESLGCIFSKIVSIGDRMAIDIEPALSLGMGGVLVDGVEDVYTLPSLWQ